MSLVTEVPLCMKFPPENLSRLRDLLGWLEDRRAEGQAILVNGRIGADPAVCGGMALLYQGVFRFIDPRLAVMFKLTWG